MGKCIPALINGLTTCSKSSGERLHVLGTAPLMVGRTEGNDGPAARQIIEGRSQSGRRRFAGGGHGQDPRKGEW